MPTDAEKGGDFSHQLTPQGTLQTIYDPFTTKFDPATSTVTRTPFPGNIIPPSRIDPAAKKLMGDLWSPNNPGTDLSGLNNFKKAYPWWENYYNFSDRVDYNLSDHWRIFAVSASLRRGWTTPTGWDDRCALRQRRHHGCAECRGGRAVDAQPEPRWISAARAMWKTTTLPSGPKYRTFGLASGLAGGTRVCCNLAGHLLSNFNFSGNGSSNGFGNCGYAAVPIIRR